MPGSRRGTCALVAVTVLAALVIAGGTPLAPRAAGATVVCGNVDSSRTWDVLGSPYYVTCDVVVTRNATLTVAPGVEVLADAGYGIYVEGGLVAYGTSNATIRFDSNASRPQPGDWTGIVVRSYGHAHLSWVRVMHAGTGLAVEYGMGSGQGASVFDSEFAFNRERGVYFNGSYGYARLEGVDVHDNGAGIYATGYVMIARSRVASNFGVGIESAPGLQPGGIQVNNTIVRDNWGSGIVVGGGPSISGGGTLTCNEVERNGHGTAIPGYGVDLRGNVGTTGASVLRNNFVDNANQARDLGSSRWDDGTYGNFWSDYNGTDGDGDGIGDAPYVIDPDSVDHFPFMQRLVDCQVPPPPPPDLPPRPATPVDARLTGTGLADVTLTWSLSPDDGGGEDDLAAYDLFESTAYDRNGATYGLLASLPPGTTAYTHTGAGAGDGACHFYRLVTRDAKGQMTPSVQQFGKYARSLAAGSHLLSLPLVVSDHDVRDVFQTVDFEVVRTYVNPAGYGKNWKNFHQRKWGDLTSVDETQGYWVLVNTDSDFVVAGLVPVSTTIPLAVGWNLVGFPSFVNRTVLDALAGANYQTVEGFDPANAPYHLRRLGPSDVMTAGEGFWIHVSEPFAWTLTN